MSADRFNTETVFVDGLDGMMIGSVDSIHITEETPLDPDQWENGQPWHWKMS
jgi:hypothetical protein